MQAIGRVAVFTAVAGSVVAQGAFTIVGSGCTTPDGHVSIGHCGEPTVGQPFDVTYSGPSGIAFGSSPFFQQPHLVVGFGLLGAGQPISAAAFPEQPVGCSLYTEHSVVVPMPPASAIGYHTEFTIDVPNDATLTGFTFLTQWVVVHIQCGIGLGSCYVPWVGTSDLGIVAIG